MADKKFLGVVLLFFIAIVLVISPPTFLSNAFGSDSNKNKNKNNIVALQVETTLAPQAPIDQNKIENKKQPESKDEATNDNQEGETEKPSEVSKTMKPQTPTTLSKKTTKPSQKPKSPSSTDKKEAGPLRYEFDEPSESDLEKLRDSCSVLDLERAAFYDNSQNKSSSSRWLFRNWCSRFTKLSSPFAGSKKKKQQQKQTEETLDPLPFRLTSDQLRSLFQDQVTLFVGDSVVRNHFVLTMARMCNEEHRGKCMIMMPTYEYDIVKPDATKRGPLGCIPQTALDERINARKGKKSTKIAPRGDEIQNNNNDNTSDSDTKNSQQEASDSSSTTSISSSPSAKKKLTGRAMKGIYKKPRIARPGPSSPSASNEKQDGDEGINKSQDDGGNQNKKEPQQQQEEKRSARALDDDEKVNSNNEDSSPPPPVSRSSPASGAPAVASPVDDADNLFAAAAKARQSAKFESLTDCYRNGTFEFVPAPGLTTNREPRRSERKAFLKKGVITPLIRMEVNRAIFYYVPVNTPKQIVKFGKWLAIRAGKSRIGSEMTKAKTVFVSTGPHLSMPEMNSSMQLLKPALSFIRSSLGADSSVLLSETTHLLNGPAWYSDFVDGVMDEWRRELLTAKVNGTAKSSSGAISATKNGDGDETGSSSSTNAMESPIVDFVPQRFVTIGGYFSTWNNPNAGFVREQDGKDKLRKTRRTCMYYDAQHPAADCQEILTELMLMAAYASRARKSRDFLKSQRNQL